MTTWLKKLRLYLLRRQLKRMTRNAIPGWHFAVFDFRTGHDIHADLINRIAEIEKTL